MMLKYAKKVDYNKKSKWPSLDSNYLQFTRYKKPDYKSNSFKYYFFHLFS